MVNLPVLNKRFHTPLAAILLLTACGGKDSVDLGNNDPSDGWISVKPDASANVVASAPQAQTLYDGGDFVHSIAVDDNVLVAAIESNATLCNPGDLRVQVCQLSDCQGTIQTLGSTSGYGVCASDYHFSSPASPLLISYGEVIWPSHGAWAPWGIRACSVTGCADGGRQIAPLQSNYVFALAADTEYVYWVTTAESKSPDVCALAVARCLRTGCQTPEILNLPDVIASVGCGSSSAVHLALSEPSGTLFAATQNGIAWLPRDYSKVPEVFYQGATKIDGLAVTSDSVYFADSSLVGRILRCSVSGCGSGPDVVAKAPRWPSDLVVDSQQAYWVRDMSANIKYSWAGCIGGGGDENCGISAREPSGIVGAPLSGAQSASTVLDDISLYASCPLAINANHLYWCEQREKGSYAMKIRMIAR